VSPTPLVCPNCGGPSFDAGMRCEHCGVACGPGPQGWVSHPGAVGPACPRCGTPASPQDRGCGRCGASLRVSCLVCRGEHPLGTRFCTQHPERSLEEAERALDAVLAGLEFAQVPAGRFVMGSPAGILFSAGEAGRDYDEVQHEVVLTGGFMLGLTAVTVAQYQALMGPGDPATARSDRPVVEVTWMDAMRFCNALSRRKGLDEVYVLTSEDNVTWKRSLARPGFRLPSEAEWEYACRAGTREARYGPVDQVAWHVGNSGGQVHPVGQKRPNPWGLYDMLGNVWEWCFSLYGPYPRGPVTDPVGDTRGASVVIRGGAYDSIERYTRAAARNYRPPGRPNLGLGFRVAWSPSPAEES